MVSLSDTGGFAISEKYACTQQALQAYILRLADGGVLSVTLWDKEEPPKSVLRFYATMAKGAQAAGGDWAKSLFVSESCLSTTTVLYRKGGFTDADPAALRQHTADLSFDEVYFPGGPFAPASAKRILEQYQALIFGHGPASDTPASGDARTARDGTTARDVTPTADASSSDARLDDTQTAVPSTTLARPVWQGLMKGGQAEVTQHYVFDIQPLTDDRPNFAGYIRPADLPRML